MAPHLGDGIESIPALLQNHRARVIEEADQPRHQASKVAGVVSLGAGAVDVEDDGSSLPHAHLRASSGFQQVLNNDAVPSVILYREDHSLTIGHLLKTTGTCVLNMESLGQQRWCNGC